MPPVANRRWLWSLIFFHDGAFPAVSLSVGAPCEHKCKASCNVGIDQRDSQAGQQGSAFDARSRGFNFGTGSRPAGRGANDACFQSIFTWVCELVTELLKELSPPRDDLHLSRRVLLRLPSDYFCQALHGHGETLALVFELPRNAGWW